MSVTDYVFIIIIKLVVFSERHFIVVGTDLFIKNGTLDFANKIKTIDHTGQIFSGIHLYPMLHVSCKFGNDIKKKS